jgi:CheY-like chemotaxis protein
MASINMPIVSNKGLMPTDRKILLVDDDQEFLGTYREFLKRLSGELTIHTAASGARALAMLEAEAYNLLLVDLKMPRMDGLQVLAIVRRRFPQVRIVVLTSLQDEHFRARAYAMGVDQYWQKPRTEQEIHLFTHSVEALLNDTARGGFRGVQSKSLVDIIQLECLSQSSSVLKISNGVLDAKIWIQNGEIIDAEAPSLQGEAAFREIFSWKGGAFEVLSPEVARTRTIFTSYQGLLLDTLQGLDESKAQEGVSQTAGEPTSEDAALAAASSLTALSQFDGVEFACLAEPGESGGSWGLDNAARAEKWVSQTLNSFRSLGEDLQVGDIQQVFCRGSKHQIVLSPTEKGVRCIGFTPGLTAEKVRDTMKAIRSKWAC